MSRFMTTAVQLTFYMSSMINVHATVNLFSPKHSCASMSSGVVRHAQAIKDQAGVAVELGHFFSDAGFLVANEVEYTHGKEA